MLRAERFDAGVLGAAEVEQIIGGLMLVGDRVVKVLTTKEPPSQTFAFLLQDLYEIPGEFIACLEWQRISSDRMRRDIQSRRRHFFNKRVSLVNYVAPETRPEEMLVDDSANTTVRQLGDALTELEVNGHFFGHCSLTLMPFAPWQPEHPAALRRPESASAGMVGGGGSIPRGGNCTEGFVTVTTRKVDWGACIQPADM